MFASMLRTRSAPFVLLALSFFLAGCGSSSHISSCAASGNGNCACGPCPVNLGPEFLFATSNSNNGEILTLSVDHNTGALGSPVSTPGPRLAAGITSTQHQFLYASDPLLGVAAFSIDQTTGALTTVPGGPFFVGGANPVSPLWLVGDTDLYATSVTGITGFTIASNGALTTVAGSPYAGGFDGQATLGQSSTTPVNHFLYATNFLDPNGTISAFKVDPTSGILTTIPGTFTTGFGSFPDGIVFDGAMGPFVFVALNVTNQIAAFSADPTTGVLTTVPGSPFASGAAPVFLALNAAQNRLYAVNFFDLSISGYSIAGNGALTPVPNSPFLLPDVPGDLVVTADNFLYVTLPKSNTIVGYSIDSSGSLTALAGSPFPASGAALLTVVQIPAP